jgi:GNAT superfamily N-acetyltransferase
LITLALATAADVDDFAALAAEMDVFYGAVRPDPPQQRAAEISAVLFCVPPNAFALLARDNAEKLVGFAAYSFLWPAVGLSTSLYLKELYVADTARRTGVATALMRGLYAIAAERGCSRVEWTTDESNERAKAFYAAFGAKPLPSKIFYRAGGDVLSG